MGRIRILPDVVASKIAAGEVVERPASVVKELLENSLDAGASWLRVEAEGGGRRLIRISDDGGGMLRDDALLAFERHATSKLSDVRDLLNIATLGFRGEALPSIASVSRLVLETRSRQEDTGTRVEIAGGKILRCDETALAPGTTVTVRDLFFNVPARKKFLRTDATELAHIAALVTHYSLAHPDKTFQLLNGPSELLHVTPVRELRERVFQVFGGQQTEDLIDLGVRERELRLAEAAEREAGEEDPALYGFALRGFVSRPQVQKLNRNSIYLFVNGRLIRDRLLLHAISAAYHNLMPPACYPFALLFLDCDCREVDVNVHPSKTEVRFRHASFVHDFVRDTIREVLLESRPAAAMPPPSPLIPAPEARPASPQPAARLPFSEFSQTLNEAMWLREPSDAPPPLPETQPENPVELPQITLSAERPAPEASPGARLLATATHLPVPDTHGPLPPGMYEEIPQSLASLPDLRPLGQLHDSFIIAAGRDGLWIIDQHVAHERILFEKILAQRAAGRVETQQLLMPIVLELTAAQQIEYARIADELNATGFESEPFGVRTVAVKAAPGGLGPAQIERVLLEILEIAERELRRASLDDLRRGIAASLACRAAIKINTRLDAARMEWLLHALARTQFPMTCPHGRPIAMRYTTRDILRGFHRV